mgnify:CR=1 FL=1
MVLVSSGFWHLAGQMVMPFYALYVLGLGGSYVDIGLISALGSIVRGIREPAFGSLFADSTNPDNRALSYALWNVVPPLFGLFSPYIMGVLIDRYGIVVVDMLYVLAWAFIDPYFVTYATEEVGLSSSQWGLTMTAMTVINILVRLPAASASDRQGRVRFIRPTVLLFPVVVYFFLNSRGFVDVLLIRLVFAVVVGFNTPAWQALFMDYAPKEHRGRFNAVLNVMRPLLWSGGTILGGYLYQTYSSRMTFMVGIGALAVGALAALLFLKEPERREE